MQFSLLDLQMNCTCEVWPSITSRN